MTEEQMNAEYTADMRRMDDDALWELARGWFELGAKAALKQAQLDLEWSLSRAEAMTKIQERIDAFGGDE